MNRLKRLRADTGLSLRDLEKLSRVTQKTISRVENDRQKAQLVTLGQLAQAFNKHFADKGEDTRVSVDDFLDLLDTGASERSRTAWYKAVSRSNDSKNDGEAETRTKKINRTPMIKASAVDFVVTNA